MDFAAMKRRELQALCKRHGLAAGGTNADLVARLTATLSSSAGAAEEAVGVVVGKGCLKRSAGGPSGGDSDAAKKVTFELEEDEEAEVGLSGRGRRRSQVMSSPAVAKTRGRRKAGEAPPIAKGSGGERRRTRSQVGGDSADEGDSGEAGADAPVRRSVTWRNSAKAEQEEVDVGDAAGRKHQLKRKTRESDIEDVDVSGQVGASRRSTRSSSHLLEPDALSSPVEKKRGRRKAADVKEKTCVEEQPTEALHSGRTLRSGVVVVAPVPLIFSESKNSRLKVQEEEPAVEKVAKVEVSRRTTRSSTVAAPLTTPSVTAKKRGRKTDDVHSDGGPDKKMENKRQSSRLTTCSSIHHLASTAEEASLEQVAAPSKGLPPRRSARNTSEANLMLNSNTYSESSNWSKAPTEGNGLKIARPTMLNAAKDGVENPDRHVGLKKSKLWNVSATVATNGGEIPSSDSSGKASATDMQIEVPGPVRRSTRKSVVTLSLEHETNDMGEGVEKKQTVTKPVGRSTRRSVAPVILEKESKGLTKEIVPEAHVKRPTRKSVVPAMLEKGRKSIITEIIPEARVKRSTRKPALPMVNSENNDHCEVVSSENLQSGKNEELEKQPTVKQPVRRLTRKSAVPAMPEKDRKGAPDMLNNENGDRTEMQSDKAGHLEKQLVVKEPVRKSTGKSIVPDVIKKENKGLHEELKSEVSVRTPVCKSVVPNIVNNENKDHNEFVRTEELSVKTRSAHTRLQVALQNDESLRRTTRKSSKLAISPPQSKPTASKGRPAKRRRTASLQEDMPAEEQKENHTNDVIEVAASTDLEIGVLPFAVEKTDLRDSQLNSELEGMVLVEPGLCHDKDDSEILKFELEGTVGITEKPPSSSPIPDCKHEGALSEVAVHSIENDAGRCSPNLEQTPTGLHSQGTPERSATHNAIPCSETSVKESDVHKVEYRVETIVSPKPDSYQGSDENSIGVEESEGYMFLCQQNNEQEGVSMSSGTNDLIESAQLDPSEDANHVVRDVITKDLICNKEEEKKDFIPSDINAAHEKSPANKPAEHVFSGVSGALFCISQSNPISDEVNADYSRLELVDALDNRIASSTTEAIQQDNKEECYLHNEGVTQGILVSDMSEAAQVEVSKSGKMLLPDIETSAFQDEQLNHKLEGNEFEEHRFSCSGGGSGRINTSQLGSEYVIDSCQEKGLELLPNDLSAVESPKGSTSCQDESVVGSGIVKGNNITMDAPGTAKQGDNLSQSATALLKNKENTPACKIDALEPSSNHLFTMDSSARAMHSVSGRPREAGLAVGNPDNKLPMEQVQQVDVQVLEGSLEKTSLGSATPESNQECRLSEAAEPHSLKNECSSTFEQSPFGLRPLFSQDDVHVQEGTLEKESLGSVTPECQNECELPDEAEPHSLKTQRCSTSVEQSPFGMRSLFSPDDAHVQEGTLEKAALGSVTPECKHECGLPDEAEPHSLKNERFPAGLEQSPSGLQPLFSQDDVHVQEGTLEKESLGSVIPECQNECELPDEAEPHSLKNQRRSTSVEQSPFGLRSLFSPDDAHVQEGTVEKAALGSATPERKQECGLPDEAEPHSLKKEICSSSVEKSPFGPQSLFSQDDVHVQEGTLEKAALGSVTPESNHECELPDEADRSLKNHRCSTSDEQSPFGLRPLFSQDDVHAQECTVEKAALGSATPECKHESGLPDEAETHSLKNVIYSSSVEQSPFGLQSLFSQDDVQVQEGTLEKTALGSVTPECKQECGLPDEAEPQPLKYERCSASVEQSPFGLVPLFSQESIEELSENGSLALARVHAENGVGESKDIHVEYRVENALLPGSVSDLDSSVDFSAVSKSEDCAYTSEQDNDNEGLAKTCLQQEQMPCQLDLLEAANCMDFTKPEEVAYDKENKKPVHSTDINSSCEKVDAKGPVKHASGLIDALLSSSLIASTDDTDVHLSSNPDQSKSTNFLGEPIGWSSTEALQQGLKEQCDEPKDYQVTYGARTNDMIEAGDLVLPSAENEDDFNTCHVELQVEKMVSSEPDLHQGSHEDLTTVEGIRDCKISSQVGDEPDKQIIAPLLAADTSALLDEQPNPELGGGEYEEYNLSSEGTSGIFDTGYLKDNLFQLHEYFHMQGKALQDDLPAPKSPEQSTIGQDKSVLGSVEINTELQYENKKEYKKHNDDQATPIFARDMCEPALFGGSGSGMTLLPTPETSPLPDEKFDPELECEELKEHNHSSDEAASDIFSSVSVKNNTCHWDDKEEYNEHNDDQATAAMLSSGMTKPTLIEGSESGMALLSTAGTPALTDEQLNSKLEDDKEQNLCFDTDTSNISDTGLMENSNLFSFPEEAHTETCYEHELPIGTPAAKSTEESAVCPDGSVLGSVGTCQTSGRQRISEISTKLLRFKISSTVKGSYIAMDSANTKQVDNPSLISLLGNTENVPAANPDHSAELNTDWLDVKDSSRQGTTDGL